MSGFGSPIRLHTWSVSVAACNRAIYVGTRVMDDLGQSRATATESRIYTFAQEIDPGIRLTNFWPPEDGFAWSRSTWCEIAFPALEGSKGNNSTVELALDLDVFRSAPHLEGQNVFIYVNGLRLASRHVLKRLTLVFELPAARSVNGENVITIDTPDAASPYDYGADDERQLGVQLFSITARATAAQG